MTPITDQQPTPAADFLIAEYQEISQEFRRTREGGLARLNFLITLTSSILAGLILLAELGSLPAATYQFVATGAILFLIVIAWGTFGFSIYRDIASDSDVRASARIRKHFANQEPAIKFHLTWQDHDEPTFYIKENRSDIRRTAQSILALLIGLLVGILLNLTTGNLAPAAVIGILFVVLAWFLLLTYARRQLKKAYESALRDVRFPRAEEIDRPTSTNN